MISLTGPFSGATQKGLERINGRITQGEAAARLAIMESVAKRGEAVIEIAYPSTRSYEREWEWTAKYRKSESIMAWVEAIFVSAGNTLIALTIGVGLILAAVTYFGKSGLVGQAVIPILLVAAGIGLGVSANRFLKAVKARAEGHVDVFIDQYLDCRALRAVAMTNEALYFSEKEKDSKATTVSRISYTDIQACAFSVDGGLSVFRVFSKDGNHYALADPCNERIRGASHLRELVVDRLKGSR